MKIIKEIVSKGKELLENQQLKNEQKKYDNKFKAKLEAQALSQEAKDAEKEIKLINQIEKDKAKVQQLKDLKQRHKPESGLNKLGNASAKFLDGMADVADRFESTHKDDEDSTSVLGNYKSRWG